METSKWDIKDRYMAFFEIWAVPFFFFLLYIIWPTNNSTVDGWAYAEEIKYGYNLFRPHHLLYNAIGYGLIQVLNFLNFHPEVLPFLKVLNALFAFFILVIMGLILAELRVPVANRNSWLFFVGSSFGFWRFATENEAYLLPILLSLTASFYFLLFLLEKKRKHLLFTALFASLTCLAHQLHVFWWLALLAGLLASPIQKRWVISYLAVSLIIPLSYLSVLYFYEKQSLTFLNVMNFVLHDYNSGSADASVDYRNFLLTPISLFRTFFQVHGNILLLLKSFPWLYGMASFAIVLAVASLYEFRKFRWAAGAIKQPFFKLHLMAFVLHFLFAFFSHGNAEFMVVLIVIVPLLFSLGFKLSTRFLCLIASSMFIWNFSLAIFPNNHLDYNNHEEVVRFVRQHPDAAFVVRDKHAIATRFYYETGVSVDDRLFEFPHDMDDPLLCSLQRAGVVIFSDVFSRKTPLSRASLLTEDKINGLELIEVGVKTFPSFYGEFTIDRISVVCD
jgi:hypothetical protein